MPEDTETDIDADKTGKTPSAPARNKASWALNTLAVLGLLAATVLMRGFLMPVFLAFLLALTFSPVRRALKRIGVPAPVSAAGMVLGLATCLTVFFALLADPVQEYLADSRQIAADVERKLRGISETIGRVAEAGSEVEKLATGGGEEQKNEVVVSGPSLVSRIAANAPFVLGQIVFTLVLLFFITASGDLFYQKIVEVSPTFRDKRRAIEAVREVEQRISRYFLTITAINLGLGVSVGLCFWLLGVPNPLLFGVLAFLLNFIPYLGSIAGMAVTFAISIVTFDQVSQALLPVLAYFLLTTLEGQFVTPFAVGKRLSLNPVVVFISVAYWGWAWSFIGMFIAVPLLLVVVVIFERVNGLQGIAVFLSGPDSPEDD